MLELMSDLSGGVLGFTAIGKVTGDDYSNTLVPAVEKALETHKKISLLYHCGEQFEGFDAKAAWEDTKVGFQHMTDWERIAVVTDVGWMKTAVRTFAFAMPSLVKVFSNDELATARDWVQEGR